MDFSTGHRRVPCRYCGRFMATAAALRRHINARHERRTGYLFECGRQYSASVTRSRCRARHVGPFRCRFIGCSYRSDRRSCLSQHMRRQHLNLLWLEMSRLSLGNLVPAAFSQDPTE
ncbi:hypothetical protein M407DRAFT_115613 [Tulasnella calospora MUT 4182]|uniref:C2H2-type domain-containing protein n=1 Tax=Tulasnella calospora MUT 4182 TaxID=1051891 RepID=A0A0C3LDY4_9AGAM|nr:hypothetical protein M407DRAFT_115613 [Tulasnella calospora MUT 4182]